MNENLDLEPRHITTMPEGGRGLDSSQLLDGMPAALFVLDRANTIVFANRRLVEMLGSPSDRLVGRSLVEFIHARDLDAVQWLLGQAPEDDTQPIGPLRVRLTDAAGRELHTELWAHRTVDDLGLDGFVVTVMPESVSAMLDGVVTAIVDDEPLSRTLAALAGACRAAPLVGVGTLLVVEPSAPTDEDRFSVAGEWPLAPELVNAWGTPWRRALVQVSVEDIVDCSLGGIDARTGAEMAHAGLPGAWIRPIAGRIGEVVAVLIVWRRDRRLITQNQEAQLGGLAQIVTMAIERSRHREELDRLVHRDALTGVGSSASLSDRIETEQSMPAVLYVDLDRFKHVNETFGHAVGDEVIALVGRRIAESVRATDDVYRCGGDEFVVVCDDADDRDTVRGLAERIVERLAAPFDCREHRVRIGASVGIARSQQANGERRSFEATIAAASRAMNRAKERGRHGIGHADLAS